MATVVHQQQHPPSSQHLPHLPQTQITPHMSPTLPLQTPHSRSTPILPPLPPPAVDPPTSALPPSPQPLHPAQPLPQLQHANGITSSSLQQQPIPSSSKPPVQEVRDRDVDIGLVANLPSGSSDKKRPRTLMEEASIVPADDRNEWYYPAAPRPAALADAEEHNLDPASSTGNWGNKLIRGARWVRQGQMTSWGPSRVEWEMENRARKRLKSLLPDQGSPSSPPLPTLPHLRSPTPPLVAPYALPPRTHNSYTSLLVDPSVQHTYTNTTVASLERTATEFIEGEGALRTALGALWQAMSHDWSATLNKLDASEQSAMLSADAADPSAEMSIDQPGVASNADGTDVRMGSPSSTSALRTKPPSELVISTLDPLRQLFISPTPVVVGSEGAQATLHPVNQLQSFDWAVESLRELYDDTREYMDRLDEVRELSGRADAARKDVWKVIKEKALEEMEDQDSQGEDDDGDDGSEY